MDAIDRAFLGRLRGRRPLRRFLARLARAVAAAGGECFLVGGFVRDLAEGRPGKDVDLMVAGIPREPLGKLLRGLPARALGIRRVVAAGKAFPVFKVRTEWERDDIDVAPCRGLSAREDAARRDFTINSLLFRLEPKGRSLGGSLVDHFGGLGDLARRRIRAVGNPGDRFAEDPVRVLRAIRFRRERPGHAIDRATWAALAAAAPRLPRAASADRIAVELVRSLSCDAPGTLADLQRANLLSILIPETPDWGEGAFARARRRYRFLEAALGRPLPEPVLLGNLLAEAAVAESDALVRRAANEGRSLERRDLRLPRTSAAARRLRLPRLREVTRMLEDLARLRNVARFRNPRSQAERILGREERSAPILALYAAVERSLGGRPEDFRKLLKTAAARPPLLSGRRLLRLGIPAGRSIDAILDEVREATLSGRIRTRGEAERLALAIHPAITGGRRGTALQWR